VPLEFQNSGGVPLRVSEQVAVPSQSPHGLPTLYAIKKYNCGQCFGNRTRQNMNPMANATEHASTARKMFRLAVPRDTKVAQRPNAAVSCSNCRGMFLHIPLTADLSNVTTTALIDEQLARRRHLFHRGPIKGRDHDCLVEGCNSYAVEYLCTISKPMSYS
jgi:hypothetical protein